MDRPPSLSPPPPHPAGIYGVLTTPSLAADWPHRVREAGLEVIFCDTSSDLLRRMVHGHDSTNFRRLAFAHPPSLELLP